MPRPTTVVEREFVERATRTRKRYERAEAQLDEVRRERAALIADMRAAGYGYDVISRVIGVSKTRVEQLVRENP